MCLFVHVTNKILIVSLCRMCSTATRVWNSYVVVFFMSSFCSVLYIAWVTGRFVTNFLNKHAQLIPIIRVF